MVRISARSVCLVDDRRGAAETHQEQFEDQTTRAAVAVEEWLDLLKAGVQPRERLGLGFLIFAS